MKITKNFSAAAKGATITFKTRQLVPLPVSILSAALELHGDAPDEDVKTFEISVNGEPVFAGQARAGERIEFDPPLRLKLGMPSIVVTSHPYREGYKASGKVHLTVAVG